MVDLFPDAMHPPGEVYGLTVTSAIVTVNDVPTPEPASMLLFAMGLAAMGAFRRLRD